MYEYYRAIGMSRCSQYVFDKMERLLEYSPNVKVVANNNTANDNKIELTMYFKENLGIRAYGFENRDGTFVRQAIFPFLDSERFSVLDSELNLNRKRNSEEVLLNTEVENLGCRLITFVQNIYEVTDGESLSLNEEDIRLYRGISLTGLATNGLILLPRGRSEDNELEKIEARRRRIKNDIQQGKDDAFEELTLTEIEIYSKIDKRVKENGVYGVVENTFMPRSLDPDIYMVIGTIEDVREIRIDITEELVYLLDLSCYGMNFIVAINSEDLVGLPREGRRFKGMVWMQSKILV